MKTAALLALQLALLLASGVASAQTVWRCGPTGAVYSDIACPQDGRQVLVADARSGAELQAARALAAREARLAERLAEDARQREAAAGSGMQGIRSPAVLVPRSRELPRRKAAPFTVRLAKTAA